MNPVDEFLKVAVSREKIEEALDEAKRRASKLRHQRRQISRDPYSPKAWAEGAKKQEAKATARVKRLEGAYERRLSGSGLEAKYLRKSGKPLKPGGKIYTFQPTRERMRQAHRWKATQERKERLGKSIKRRQSAGARLRERQFEGRGALRKRKAVKVSGPPKKVPTPTPRPSAPKPSPLKPATSTAKTVTKAVKKGRGLGRAAKVLGAAGLLAAGGYGAYRMLKGRKKKELKKAAMVSSFFEELEEISRSKNVVQQPLEGR
jgi:hypothetical protein